MNALAIAWRWGFVLFLHIIRAEYISITYSIYADEQRKNVVLEVNSNERNSVKPKINNYSLPAYFPKRINEAKWKAEKTNLILIDHYYSNAISNGSYSTAQSNAVPYPKENTATTTIPFGLIEGREIWIEFYEKSIWKSIQRIFYSWEWKIIHLYHFLLFFQLVFFYPLSVSVCLLTYM